MSLPPLETCSDQEFLKLLAERGVLLRLQDGKLRINAPAGAVDEALKAELVRRKAILLASVSADNGRAAHPAPLSYAQERLWVLERFQPGNYAYNIPETSEIAAYVDPKLLQRAIDFVVDRHDALRTEIREDRRGVAGQYVHPTMATPLVAIDLRAADPAARERQLQERLRSLARQPFDLRVAPLVRFYLFQLEAERNLVFINMHHIISDRWSITVLLRELLAAYNAYASGATPALAPLPMQYLDYARRERSNPDAAGAAKLREGLKHWKNVLSGTPDPPQLPFSLKASETAGRPRNPFDGAIHLVELSEQETATIRALARAHKATPYMVMLAAYAALLQRYTGATDFCVGTPISERRHVELEPLIGVFVNTLAMRCRIDPAKSFADLLGGIRETVLDAQSHNHVPLQLVLGELQKERGSTPIFQTVLAFDANIVSQSGSGAFQVVLDPGFAKFDMTLQFWESRERIGGWMEYRTDLYSAGAIARFAESFTLLLRDAVAHPQKEVRRLDLIGEEERRRLLFQWNDTAMEFPRHQALPKLFEEQVRAKPDAPALVHGEERVSYRELNGMANGIAHALLRRNLPVESIVGVHLQRSVRMIAAMLGILKAGAAYLPLDPEFPEDRLRFMVEDSRCGLVVSDSWTGLPGCEVLTPEAFDVPSADFGADPDVAVEPSNLAYVIYTSGSTGRPKGVAIEHHSVVSFLTWCRRHFSEEELRGTLAATTISFDLSVFEIFLPLICGHTVILAKDILEFPSLPAAHEVTLVNTVPSAAAALLDTKAIPRTLRTINCAGEALSAALADRLYAETNVAAVNDLFGPTETTVYSTWNRRAPGGPATIGRPLGNTRVYMVDSALELVPQGVPGELLIAGEGVARGYLERPELNGERFVALPHLGEAGRAYRTGDLCRYHDDGTIEYLGRLDQQVKVRGYRIETGEVEAALLKHPSLHEAAVVAHVGPDGVGSLVAAVRLDPSHSLDIPALVAHQSRILPAYMIVRNIVAVEEFPRTSNGKIERKKIGLLVAAAQKPAVASEVPSDPIEREVAGIWRTGFGTDGIGLDDDFFQIGGHSLLALRIFAEIEAKLGCRMMLSVLFQAPTIRLLAAQIREMKLA